jgi:hypothetical protein
VICGQAVQAFYLNPENLRGFTFRIYNGYWAESGKRAIIRLNAVKVIANPGLNSGFSFIKFRQQLFLPIQPFGLFRFRSSLAPVFGLMTLSGLICISYGPFGVRRCNHADAVDGAGRDA